MNHHEQETGSAPFTANAGLLYGGGKGIGRAVATAFAKRGARMTLADIDLAAAQETAALIGAGAIAIKCNVLDDESVRATVEAAEVALGDLHNRWGASPCCNAGAWH
jgi:NAD(P)-dependent dehydrogenase (short-subunit alcohol dehydrogenase family)